MKIFAQIIGFFAVVAFLLSYQQKKRNSIIVWNVTSRCLYIIQYVMLGAFEGAVLDVLGIISSMAAQYKNKSFINKYLKNTVIINLIIIIVGLLLYENVFSLFPIVGVILHTSAFWINKESIIRKISFLGSPFWLVYNVVNSAYGSALGDMLTMISIGIAIYRYDIRKNK